MNQLTCQVQIGYPSGFALDVAWETSSMVTALFGPSGSGKTTVLMMLCGLLTPSAGKICYGNEVWFDSARRICQPPQRRAVGMVFQDQRLFPHKTVEGNLVYGLRRALRGGAAITLAEIVDVLELQSCLARRPDNLSGGERQRVALGRALLARPRLLLMDEPLVALDDRLRMQILDYLERVLVRWQIPTIFVSHVQAEVRRLADRAVVLDGGRVVEQGATAQALAQPIPLHWQGESRPMNLLRVDRIEIVDDGARNGRLGEQGVSLPPCERELLKGNAAGKTVWVALDPKEVILGPVDTGAELSARNRWRGVVRQIVAGTTSVMVAVEVDGQIVWAELTTAAVEQLRLSLGAATTCIVKTHSLRLVE